MFTSITTRLALDYSVTENMQYCVHVNLYAVTVPVPLATVTQGLYTEIDPCRKSVFPMRQFTRTGLSCLDFSCASRNMALISSSVIP